MYNTRANKMMISVLSLLMMVLTNVQLVLINAITEPSDVEALMQVKAALDPASMQAGSCVSTWDFSVDPCENLFGADLFSCGINCQSYMGGMQRITTVKLDSSGYGGTLSLAIGNLTFLQYLQVAGNALGGPIPSSIGQLNQLIILDLSSNSFTGTLPDSIGSLQSLQSLNAGDNLLRGVLPGALSGLTNLVELRMEHNLLYGSLPDLSSLKRLQVLDLSYNGFSGGIPLKFPPFVISVSLKSNGLTGGLTKDHINGLNPMLNVLDLGGNNLSGPIDAFLFKHPSLQQLNLSNNGFTKIINWLKDPGGVIPSQMVAVDLSNNQIAGSLPSVFASMERLSSLSLSHNAFNGRIHMSYALKAVAGMVGLQPLQRLMLDGNYLSGPLPPLFMKLLPGSIVASFVDNCLLSCPSTFFFCQGGNQKPDTICRLFNTSA